MADDLLSGSGNQAGAGSGGGAPPAAAPAAAAAPMSVVGADGAFTEGWTAVLPEDMRSNPSLAGFKSLPDLAKSLVNTKRMVGADKARFLFAPNENSSPEERADFYSKLGRPESPDKYAVEMPKNLPQGMGVNEQMKEHFAKIAHESGLSNDQFKAMFDGYNQFQMQSFEQSQEQQVAKFEDGVKELQKEWRGDYDSNLKIANRAVQEFGLKDFLDQKGLSNDTEMVKVMHKIGSMLLESKGPEASNSSGASGSAQQQIDAIRADSKHPLHHRDMPGHDQAVALMQRLYEKLG